MGGGNGSLWHLGVQAPFGAGAQAWGSVAEPGREGVIMGPAGCGGGSKEK